MTRLVTDWQGSQTITKDQALDLAIEELKKSKWYFEQDGFYSRIIYIDKAINACEQALKENPHGS